MQVSTRAHAIGAAIAGAAVFLMALGDVHRGTPHLPVVFAARAVWGGALLGLAAYIVRAKDRQLPLPAAIAAVASIVALAALAWADGVAGTGAVSYLVAAPLFVALIVPDPRVAATAAVASVAGTLAVAATASLPASDVAMVSVRSAFAGAFAVFGSALQARARRAEVALAGERARALDALAASERRRAEAEPLAAAGSRAAAVAHDMAGPIAAIRANLDWLGDALQDGRLPDASGETRSVLEDGRAAVDALVRALTELRRASEAARPGGGTGGRSGEGPPARAISGE